MRGEYGRCVLPSAVWSGSSPRAWGIHRAGQNPLGPARFIPTCVGNTSRGRNRRCWAPVHPHVRGEYRQMPTLWSNKYGSSPRAWGIPQGVRAAGQGGRFIPTCVGNTESERIPLGITTVHPHVRGEYCTGRGRLLLIFGSSPRAWGIRAIGNRPALQLRFIPTCVGNTSSQSRR